MAAAFVDDDLATVVEMLHTRPRAPSRNAADDFALRELVSAFVKSPEYLRDGIKGVDEFRSYTAVPQ